MIREEAKQLVEQHTTLVGTFKSVPTSVVKSLFEFDPTRFEELTKDPIKKRGPSEDSIYPWNVLDYLDDKFYKPKPKKPRTDLAASELLAAAFETLAAVHQSLLHQD